MSQRFDFDLCPNCKRRAFLLGLFGRTIYRCRACMTIFCDDCMRRGWLTSRCPHCGARLDGHNVIGHIGLL